MYPYLLFLWQRRDDRGYDRRDDRGYDRRDDRDYDRRGGGGGYRKKSFVNSMKKPRKHYIFTSNFYKRHQHCIPYQPNFYF